MESSPPDQLSFHFSPLLLRAHPFFHTRTLLTHLQRPPFPFIFPIAVKYSSYTHFSLPPSSRQTHSSVATNKYLLFHTFPPPILFFLKNENLPRGKPCISRGKDDLNHLSLFLQGIQRSILRIESIDLHGGGGGGGSLRPYSPRVQMLALSKILLIKLPHGFFNPSVRNPRARASFDRYFLVDWIVRFLLSFFLERERRSFNLDEREG